MRIYHAGPLFTSAEQDWNRLLALQLEQRGFEVWLPQDEQFEDIDISPDGEAASWMIFQANRRKVLLADVVLANLDGTQVDDGTAWEVGFAAARGVEIIGYRTDFRAAGDHHDTCVNLMVEHSLTYPVIRSDEPEYIADTVQDLLQGDER